jgi:hypothetical protein
MRTSRFILAALLISITLSATTVVPASVERLTVESTHVVLAQAVDSRASWNADHTRIYTYTRFQLLQSMKGTLPQSFTVKRLGGSAEGYTMKVAGVRSWRPGEQAVLFLQPDIDNTFFTTSLMQGDFRIQRQASGTLTVSNGVSGAKQVQANGQLTEFQGSRMTLDELQRRVRRVASQ